MVHENIDVTYHDPKLVSAHIIRYAFVLPDCHAQTVVDVGCGQGYGSWILSQQAERVYALDNRDGFQDKYRLPNNEFHCVDWLSSECDKLLFGITAENKVFIAFECIEHMDTPQLALGLLWDRMKPGDKLIGSLPINQGLVAYHLCGDMSWADWAAFVRLVGEPCVELHQTLQGLIYPRDMSDTSSGQYIFGMVKQ